MLITQTPLRVSFLGGGTDYPEYFEKHGGAVLGTAVDKAAFFTASHFYSRMFDHSIRIAYRKVESAKTLDEIEHVPFRECLRWAGVTTDIEIHHAAELPAMTGLGSSSAFVVGLLNTLHAYRGRAVRPLDLAYQAIDLERNVLGESVGCQDQTFAAVGGFNLIEFRRAGDFAVHRLPLGAARLDEFEAHLLCFFTGIKRRAEELAARQVGRVDHNKARLSRMRAMVDEGYEALVGAGDMPAFGRLLHRSWVQKRELDDAISNGLIDQFYQAGLDAGAFGGKLLGAGGGGFLMFFAPPEAHPAIRQALGHLQEVGFRVDAPGTQVLHHATDRGGAVRLRDAA